MAKAPPVDPKLVTASRNWINSIMGTTLTDNLLEEIKDGFLLCQLVNTLKPNTCKKMKPNSKVAFVCRQNIETFLKGCKALGMKQNDLFETRDLFDGQRPQSVVNTLAALSALVEKDFAQVFTGQGRQVPEAFGAKRADKNVRNFTQEQLNKSKSAVPLLNKGSNKNDLSSGTDSTGIVKDHRGKLGLNKFSNEQGVMEKGSLANDTSSGLDSAGIVKDMRGSLGHNQFSTQQGLMAKGSLANDTGSRLDSAGIVKDMKGNLGHNNFSAQQGVMAKGSLATNTSSALDSTGIIKDASGKLGHGNYSSAQGVMQSGAIANNGGPTLDSVGIKLYKN